MSIRDICQRIERLRAANGGIAPEKLTVTEDEYRACIIDITQRGDAKPRDFTHLKIMGVDVEISPVIYPWGKFPENG